MAEPKTQCTKCGVEILQVTGQRTGGLCMPCHQGGPRRPDPNDSVEISCPVHSDVAPAPIFFTSAQELLPRLESEHHIGDSRHANKFELQAQRALVRHALLYHVAFRLNDDHWGRTGYVLIKMFEEGKATMQINDKKFHFSDLAKEDWIGSSEPLASYGGFLYRDSTGTVVYKRRTWRS
jgi:hypothetical protein